MTKETAWKWFSLYIRLRDSFEGGYIKCCTCDSYKHFRDIQAGHFLSRGAYKRIVFDERNCHAQCVACNHFKSGNLAIYNQFMVKRYGYQVVDELYVANRTNPRGYDYKELADKYRVLVKELCERKNIIL